LSGGVRSPNHVGLMVDAERGIILSYEAKDESIAAPPAPSVTRDQAIGLAAQELGLASQDARSAELAVIFDESGVQRLVWEVDLTVETPGKRATGGIVRVDAATGQVQARIVPAG